MQLSSLLLLLAPSLALSYTPDVPHATDETPRDSSTGTVANTNTETTNTSNTNPPAGPQWPSQVDADAYPDLAARYAYYGGDMTNEVELPHWHPPPVPPNTPNPPEDITPPATSSSENSSADSNSSSKNRKRAVPPHPRDWHKPTTTAAPLPSNANTALACPTCRTLNIDKTSQTVTDAVMGLTDQLTALTGQNSSPPPPLSPASLSSVGAKQPRAKPDKQGKAPTSHGIGKERGKRIGPMDAHRMGKYIAKQNPGAVSSPQGKMTADAGKRAAKGGAKAAKLSKRGIGKRPPVKPKRFVKVEEEEQGKVEEGKGGEFDVGIVEGFEEKKW